jgi:hypothetical protein
MATDSAKATVIAFMWGVRPPPRFGAAATAMLLTWARMRGWLWLS